MLVKYRIAQDGQNLTEDDVRTIIEVFYPKASWVSSFEVNDEVVDVVWEMINAARTCSREMDFVPSPKAFKPGPVAVAFILLNLANAFRKKSASEKRKIFMVCSASISNSWRFKLEAASNGI